MTLSLGFEATKQGWVYLLLMPGTTNANDVPFLGDNNAVAVGMFMLLPIALALAETASRRWERYVWIVVAVGVGYRGLTTYSRGGFLTAGVLLFLYILRSKRHRIRRTVMALAAAGILLSTMPQAFWARVDTIAVEEEGERDASAASRLYFWQVAVDMARANPLLGVGHSAFNYAYDDFDRTEGEYGMSRSVHSSWFGLLSEGGFLGFGLVVCAFLRALLQNRRIYRELGPDDPRSKLAKGVQNGLLAFAVGGSFVAMQYNEMLWHFIGLSFAAPMLLKRAQTGVADASPVSFAARSSLGDRAIGQPVPARSVVAFSRHSDSR
jgi:probable O-glycosylation ligase (exosortase A-associated)